MLCFKYTRKVLLLSSAQLPISPLEEKYNSFFCVFLMFNIYSELLFQEIKE